MYPVGLLIQRGQDVQPALESFLEQQGACHRHTDTQTHTYIHTAHIYTHRHTPTYIDTQRYTHTDTQRHTPTYADKRYIQTH